MLIEVSFFGGPWDAEDHEVAGPHPPMMLVVPVISAFEFAAEPTILPTPRIETAVYHLHEDDSGLYYVCG